MAAYGVDCGGRKVAIACPEKGEVWSAIWTASALELHQQIGRESAAQIPVGSLVVIEAAVVAGARNLQSSLSVAMTVGAVKASLPGRDVRLVAVSSWKKAVTGRGDHNKLAIAAWLKDNDPDLFRQCLTARGAIDQDRVDATCIGLYAKSLLASESGL